MSSRAAPALLVLTALACADEQPADDEIGSETTSEGSGTDESDASESASGETDESTDTGESTETGEPALVCNGHAELCDRPLDEVVFAGTHNSHASSEDGFSQFNTNQAHAIPTQLAEGVRLLLIDTYYAEDQSIVLCHGPCNLGSISHLDTLQSITDFLVANPGEVIAIIYQDAVDAADLALDYAATGAEALTYAHPVGEPWPTLGELIEADTRLLVTVEQGGPPPAWHQHVWDLAWDTAYAEMDPADMSCELNRGSPDNDLFLLNHWVANQLGLPSPEGADIVNQYDFLLARAQECWEFWDHPPNFVAVDFYDRGDLVAVVDTLNGF
ncbi:hypothetical protein ACNOYE_24815 [Nannocystaceae bacterium ST9]